MAEGTGEKTLPRPHGVADEDGLAVPDPLPGGEGQDEGWVQSAGRPKAYVFDGGVEVEPSEALEMHVAALLPFGLLAFRC